MKPGMPAVCLAVIAALAWSAPALAQFGFGGSRQDIELLGSYDQDGDGYLNRAERDAYRFRGRPSTATVRAGESTEPELTPADVEVYDDEPLYAADVLRTLFVEFEYPDWEAELESFYGSDVDIPATVIVDGETYTGVGIHFRGNTSYRSVGAGRKRGLNLSVDFIDEDQRLLGYSTLNLLNGFGDPTFLRQVLYLRIANAYYPAPKANFVRVVINGQDWGVYVSVQQFNSDFTREAYDSNEARWRIQGSFSSSGGLEYLGTAESAYRREYDIKNKDTAESWAALIELTRVLNQTPPAELVAALEPIFDIDGALRFLAVDNALQNSDGYWARNSDYSLYRDEDGRFHVTAYDANEALREGMNMRGFGGRGGGASGAQLDPLEGSNDGSKAMLYRLLRVPELQEAYLGYVRDVAENWLDWERLGPIVEDYRALIGDVVAADNRKLFSTAEFELGVDTGSGSVGGSNYGIGGPPGLTLRAFIEQRQSFLLDWLDSYAGRARL
jgi:hypothetical protein